MDEERRIPVETERAQGGERGVLTDAAAEPTPGSRRDWPEGTVLRARDAYLAENGFTVEGYDAKWTEASFLGIPLRVPNTRHHAWAIQRHDLHHVATGYGTDLVGEGEISAWELARGMRGLGAYVGAIVLTGAAMGLLFAPRRTLRAWRASRRAGGGGSLFQSRRSYEKLLALSVAKLRRELGVPEGGVAEHPRRLHAYAPRPAATPARA